MNQTFKIAGQAAALMAVLLHAIPSAAQQAAVPNRAYIHYAKGLAIEYHTGYKVLRVLTPWRDAKTQFTYVLVDKGAPLPHLSGNEISGNEIVVRTPVRRFVVTSTVFVPSIAMLGLEDTLIAVAGGRMISTPTVAKRYAERRIAEVGSGFDGMSGGINMELLMNRSPELVMVTGTGNPTYDFHEQLHNAGIPFALNGEYMETSPLGEAEWIKFVAAFFDKDGEAERIFSGIAARYEAEATKARAVKTRPTVFSSADYRGVWYMPGGRSYRAQIFRDAGAHYLWDEDRSEGTLPLSMEAVVARAKDADFWIDPGTPHSMTQLAGLDERYRTFRAFRTGQVFNNDVRMGPGGGNDYWETGLANPDVVLADMISIFHPELEPKHKRVYYRKLPEKAAP